MPWQRTATSQPSTPWFPGSPSGVLICCLEIHKVHRLCSHDRHWFVLLLRRIFTIAIALALLAFSFTNLVLEPVQEAGMTPQKIYTTPAYTTFIHDIVDGNWSIVAVSKIPVWQLCSFRTVTTCYRQFARNDTFGDGSKLRDAINVNAWRDDQDGVLLSSHWAGHSVWVVIVTINPCAIRNELEDPYIATSMLPDNTTMVVFDCPWGFLPDLLDLLITVNFTTLGINATFPPNSKLSAVSIVTGFHMDTRDATRGRFLSSPMRISLEGLFLLSESSSRGRN